MLFIPLLSPILSFSLSFSLSFLTVKSFDLFSPQFLQTRTFDNTPVLPVKYQERCWLSDWVIAFSFLSSSLSLWNWGDFCLNALEVKRERERNRLTWTGWRMENEVKWEKFERGMKIWKRKKMKISRAEGEVCCFQGSKVGILFVQNYLST